MAAYFDQILALAKELLATGTGPKTDDLDVSSLPDSMYKFLASRAIDRAETCDDAVAGFSELCEALGQHVIGSNSLDDSEKSETNLLFKLFQNSLSIIVPFANIPVALPFITRCCLPVLQCEEKIYCHKLVLAALEKILNSSGSSLFKQPEKIVPCVQQIMKTIAEDVNLHLGVKDSLCKFTSMLLSRLDSKVCPGILADGICDLVVPLLKQCAPTHVANISAAGVTRVGPRGNPAGANPLHFALKRTLILEVLPAIKYSANFQAIKQLWTRLIEASEANMINHSIVCDIANSLITDPIYPVTSKADSVDMAWIIITDPRMWSLAERCLFQPFPIYQKRSMQLLWTVVTVLTKRAELDKRSQRQRLRLWELFASIIESLQQFAFHLVEPLWKKMIAYMCKPANEAESIDTTVRGTARSLLSGSGFAFVPIVLSRFFAHGNPHVKVFALKYFMTKGAECGLWGLVDVAFVSKHIMKALNETSLFRKDIGADLARVVSPFFPRYFSYLLRDGDSLKEGAPAQFIWHILCMAAQTMLAAPLLRLLCTFLLSLRSTRQTYMFPVDFIAAEALPMNTVTLDAAALSSLRSALKHSGTSSDGLVKLLRQLLVSSYFEVHSQPLQRLAMLAFLSMVFIFVDFEQVDYTAFGHLLHVMKPQHLKDMMPMMRTWCAECSGSDAAVQSLGLQMERLLKADVRGEIARAIAVARLAYVLGAHKGVKAALSTLLKTLGMCYSQLYLPSGQVAIAFEVLAEILTLCRLLEPALVPFIISHEEPSFFGEFLLLLQANSALVQVDNLLHATLVQACSPPTKDAEPARVDVRLCTHILASLLRIFPDQIHLCHNAGKLVATIQTTLNSANTAMSGDSAQRCLAVLTAVASSPFLHSSSRNTGGLIMAVNRLDVIKLQSSSTGTGHTRIGGTRRSLLVDQENESQATLYQLKWLILAKLLASTPGRTSAVKFLSGADKCALAHSITDAIPTVGHQRTLIPVLLTLAQLMPMMVHQYVRLNAGSSNVKTSVDEWPDLAAVLQCAWMTYLDLPRSQQSFVDMQVALLQVLFHESLFASPYTNQLPEDLAGFYRSCGNLYTDMISDTTAKAPRLHIRCVRAKPTKLYPSRWRSKDLTVTLLEKGQQGLLKQYFTKVCVHSIKTKRLSLLVQFAAHLCAIWKRETVERLSTVGKVSASDTDTMTDLHTFPVANLSALAFIPEIVHFLTLGQYDAGSAEPLKPPLKPRQLTRVVVLSWLDGFSSVLHAHPEPAKNGNNSREWLRLRTFMDAIILFLLEENFTPQQNEGYMPGSAMFGIKLRQWQALGVLSRAIHSKLVLTINSYVWDVLDRLHQPRVRFEIELFLATLCIKFPELTLRQHLMPRLRDCNTNPQTATSCLVLTAWVFAVMQKQIGAGDNTNLEVYTRCYDDFAAVVSGWLSCPDGLCRTTAQWVTHALFFKTLTSAEKSNGVRMSDKDRRFLRQVVDYLENNKKCGAMRIKQNKLFALVDPVLESSLAGLLHRGPLNRFQDFISAPLTVQLRDVMRETFNEFNKLQGPMGGPHASRRFAKTTSARAFVAEKSQVSSTLELSFTVQKKRRMAEDVCADSAVTHATETGALKCSSKKITASDLHSTLDKVIDRWRKEEEQDKNERNGRQSIVVVASLIDKAPNLGGLARTCEVFRAEELVLNNIKIKQQSLFKQISVTADRWMPMREVRKEHLLVYLQQKRRDGYTLVGLEQASNSVMLERFEFPKKVILLLGEEKGGIPALLLQLLDVCIEIPQLGLIRSLNVHVSASMLLWEYTRQQRLK